MHDRTAMKSAPTGWGVSGSSREAKLRRRFPTIEDMRKAAERRIPSLGYETVAGGAGQNLAVRSAMPHALDAIELVPRVGADRGPVPTDVTLFGRHYAAPIGIAPMGLQSVFWPGAERLLAKAAQRARIPYTAGTVSGVALEELAKLAPDVMWFQLYRLAKDDHRVGIDLVRRARDGRRARAGHDRRHAGPRQTAGRVAQRPDAAVPSDLEDDRAGRGLAALAHGTASQRPAQFSLPRTLLRPEPVEGRYRLVRAARSWRRIHLRGAQALSRSLEGADGHQGRDASGRCGEQRLRSASTAFRFPTTVAGNWKRLLRWSMCCPQLRVPSRAARDIAVRWRRAIGARRGADAGARRRRGAGRAGPSCSGSAPSVPTGPIMSAICWSRRFRSRCASLEHRILPSLRRDFAPSPRRAAILICLRVGWQIFNERGYEGRPCRKVLVGNALMSAAADTAHAPSDR